ncbi:CLUMA_CG003017, isoform A [Clunio marinus]|uniref:CLUMA_CG003017, isoform A n=1 Tax=Clunio marinus TaxID=568069 RepID=A0A1J1HNZ9_9DIPT|nr:CLUMA_CG003017, isoform A [Clunio marinus]
MAMHCIDETHEMAEGKIIKEVRDERQLDAWESLYIENGTELTNIDDPPIKSSLFKIALTH